MLLVTQSNLVKYKQKNLCIIFFINNTSIDIPWIFSYIQLITTNHADKWNIFHMCVLSISNGKCVPLILSSIGNKHLVYICFHRSKLDSKNLGLVSKGINIENDSPEDFWKIIKLLRI